MTFPFCSEAEDEAKRYDIERKTVEKKRSILVPFADEEITRDFNLGSDTWSAGDLSFTVYSPVCSVPDPKIGDQAALKQAINPAVYITITVDNTKGTKPRKAFFGFGSKGSASERIYPRRLDDVSNGEYVGVGQGRHLAIVSKDEGVKSALGTAERILTEKNENNYTFGLSATGLMLMEVAAGEKRTFSFAGCFYKDGYVTTALDTTYYYTKFFKNIEAVAKYSLDNFDALVQNCLLANEMVADTKLSPQQRFMLIHSIRSYYGSTEFLELDGEPLWFVNEGEYRMMNTMDLTVDQLYYEMKMNPWTVRNELDQFINRYSYYDTVAFPGQDEEYPGGISFTHDMGVANVLSRPGHSAYEKYGISGCFSQMTHEQLVNWICCATVYVNQAQDQAWLEQHMSIFVDCFKSMVNRDHHDPKQRDGIMSLDTSRVMGGDEITTYDSLDISLGQARNNIYLAVKCWASYVALEQIFKNNGHPELAQEANEQAHRCANTLVAHVTKDGYIPAVLENDNDSKIIPAIEGLIFPYFTNCEQHLSADGEFGHLISALKNHLEAILVPGVCLFDDGGWKLSSTSNNSWLSKIYLCQFVARKILGIPWDEKGHAADQAHVNWLLHPEQSYWAWSDQILAGYPKGSKYYPRGVTSILWLYE